MFKDEMGLVGNAAKSKVKLLETNFIGYFMAALLAGIYVGFGILLIFTIGGQLAGAGHTKLIMGASFGIALSLVIMAGAELFTGNVFVMISALLRKDVTGAQAGKVLAVSYIGNWLGSALLALLFVGTGLADGPVGEFMANGSAGKMNAGFSELFVRGILCNTLVCLAVWCGIKLKSESGKLIMIFWCLFAFITSGFEHSIANMSLLTVSLFKPFEASVSLGGYFYNILTVSVGNILGAIVLLALPYYFITKDKG